MAFGRCALPLVACIHRERLIVHECERCGLVVRAGAWNEVTGMIPCWRCECEGGVGGMSDFSRPNAVPGRCVKCGGTGEYRWGVVVNGAPRHVGRCHSCGGTGVQTRDDIARNTAYNRYKLASLSV